METIRKKCHFCPLLPVGMRTTPAEVAERVVAEWAEAEEVETVAMVAAILGLDGKYTSQQPAIQGVVRWQEDMMNRIS